MKAIESVVLAIIAVFAPIQAAIATTFALILVDMVTGVMAARKRGEPITSSGLKRTIGKILLYEAALCIAYLVQAHLTGDLFPASKVVTALVGLTELKSVMENMDILSGNGVFKALLVRITLSKDDLERDKK